MINPDFSDRTYTAEVIKTKADTINAFDAILKLAHSAQVENYTDEGTKFPVKIGHAFLASKREYHRFPKTITLPDGKSTLIPRQTTIKGQEVFLYDVFVAQSRYHMVIAVPFHELAEEFFMRVDRTLAGTNTRYEKLDITKMVIKLGTSGAADVPNEMHKSKVAISVTRCHLAYADQKNRTSNLQQIRMTGANLGMSKEYTNLIAPVLNSRDSDLTVTPVVLGFALLANGVKKSSATTDRHGNFKLWIAPGLRRLIRLFDLLDTLESMKDITLMTSNVPILQSKTIRDAED